MRTRTDTATYQDEEAVRAIRQAIGIRMDELRRERGLEVKTLCEEMGWHKSEYSRKFRGLTPVLDHEMVMLRRILRGPTHWPNLSMEESILLDALGRRVTDVLRRIADVTALLDSKR